MQMKKSCYWVTVFPQTEVAWSASKIKQNMLGFSDVRSSFMGDGFAICSFVMLAVACCRKFLPRMPDKLLRNRMRLAPGFPAPVRFLAPLQKQLVYGTPHHILKNLDFNPNRLNRVLLRRTNHTGSDIRIASGEILNSKAFPRQSAQAKW